jgi:hypothetical protein
MAAASTYRQIRHWLDGHLHEKVDESTRERVALLVVGIIRAKSAAPAQIASALKELGLSDAQTDSIERRVRRIENDEELEATLYLHPLAVCRRDKLFHNKSRHMADSQALTGPNSGPQQWFGVLQGSEIQAIGALKPLWAYPIIRTCSRLRLKARQTRHHSPAADANPRKENWRKPMTSLMMPMTGSTVHLRSR